MPGSVPAPRSSPWDLPAHRLAAALLIAATLVILAFQLSLVRTRTFDPDEFQHAHSAFLISKGQVPYRDYFEHHPPLLHFLMAPVVRSLHPERDGQSAMDTLFILRVLNWAVAMLGAVAHYLLARRLLGPLGGAAASLLLWSTLIVFEKALEIRPDTAAFALLQVALLLLSGREATTSRTALAFSLLGAGVLFTQKLAFPILGVVAAAWLARRVTSSSGGRALALIGVSLLWPTALVAAYFFARDAGPDFIEDVFLINLRWKARMAAWPFLMTRFVEPNPFFALLGGLGLLRGIRRWGTSLPEAPAEGTVLMSALSAALGLLLLPVAWEQYYLLLLPPLAILAGGILVRLTAALLRTGVASGAVAVAVVLLSLASLAASTPSIFQQRLRTSPSKERALALVQENSTTVETVLDGYSGIGVFRLHAFRYFFLHAEMRLMLDPKVVRELEVGLRSGTIAPRFASADSHLRALSPEVRSFLDRHFAVVGEGPVEVRLFPGGEELWDDTIVRFVGQLPPPTGPYVLADEGWLDRESFVGRPVRRSRGKISTLFFPVLHSDRIGRILITARAGASVSGMSVQARLNGVDIGEFALEPSFTESELRVPPGRLVRGLNRLEFSYPVRPAQVQSSLSAAENATLAIESLALLPRQ